MSTLPLPPGPDALTRVRYLLRFALKGDKEVILRELHGRYAEQLENLQPAPPIAWIARHRAAAGDRGRAVPLLEEAAITALAVGAASEAAAFWKEAADLSDDPVMADGFRLRAAEVSAAAAAAVVAG